MFVLRGFVSLFLLTVGLGALRAEIAATRTAGSREISGGLGRSRTSGSYGHDNDDDWLDSMLGGR